MAALSLPTTTQQQKLIKFNNTHMGCCCLFIYKSSLRFSCLKRRESSELELLLTIVAFCADLYCVLNRFLSAAQTTIYIYSPA
jgi:hypothetical protein